MRSIMEDLAERSKVFLVIFAFVLVFLVGAVEYLTVALVNLCIFYVIPIFMATWFVGLRAGITVAVVSILSLSVAKWIALGSHIYGFVMYWDTGIRFGFFLILVLLLSAFKKALKSEQSLARSDFLTGAANVRSFYEVTGRELERARRYSRPVSLAYLDIDNFKILNDRFGHSIGDASLRLVTETIKRNIRATDLVARMGGDEFAILLPETTRDSAHAVSRKIRKLLLDSMEENGWPVTFSIGLVTLVDSAASCTVDDLIRMADDLMYSAKEEGKNRIKHGIVGA